MPIKRAGIFSGVIWIIVGLLVYGLTVLLGASQTGGFLALLSGPGVVRWVGAQHGIRGKRAWTGTSLVALGVLFVAVALGSCAGAMLVYG